jgi:hypothetical protein
VPAHAKLCAFLALVLVACKGEDDPPADEHTEAVAVGIDTPAPPSPQPQAGEEVWVVLLNRAGEAGRGQFFDRIVLNDGRFESHDGRARGFAVARYAREQDETFTAEQKSTTDGTRKWSCFGSSTLMCTLDWTHADGRTETYVGDGRPANGDPFQGEWQITLRPEGGTGPELSGRASFDRGALDLAVEDKRYDDLVYWVRPPSGTVDFVMDPPARPGQVGWNGALLKDGALVDWTELDQEGPYSLGGSLTVHDAGGASLTYRVSSPPKRLPAGVNAEP